MSDKRTSLEVIAPSVEEAISKGLDDLGLPADAVDVEVLDAGSRGLFGLGSRQARIRLTIKTAFTQQAEPARPAPAPAAPERKAPAPSAPMAQAPVEESAPQVFSRPPEVEAPRPAPRTRTSAPPEMPRPVAPASEVEAEEPAGEDDAALRVARETVTELLEKMKVRARVSARYGEAEDAHSRVPLLVDVRGDDLSILIGPRAETLNALQYISGLIVSKELGRNIALSVDVEGYRARREQSIRQLARRMAEQAVKTGHRQVLEPMPANERRLIHIELRSNPDVTTESIGEEPRRKVTIIPK
jgi:spoIIIJ-associated protein